MSKNCISTEHARAEQKCSGNVLGSNGISSKRGMGAPFNLAPCCPPKAKSTHVKDGSWDPHASGRVLVSLVALHFACR